MRYRDMTSEELRERLAELSINDPAGEVSEEARRIARVLLLRQMGRPVAGQALDAPPSVGDLEALEHPLVEG
jgi:hypothetical protein